MIEALSKALTHFDMSDVFITILEETLIALAAKLDALFKCQCTHDEVHINVNLEPANEEFKRELMKPKEATNSAITSLE